VPRVHQPEGELLRLFLGWPVGGQDLFARDGIDDDDLEDLPAPANIGGQSDKNR